MEIFDLDGHNLGKVFNLTSYSYFYLNHPFHHPIRSVPDVDPAITTDDIMTVEFFDLILQFLPPANGSDPSFQIY